MGNDAYVQATEIAQAPTEARVGQISVVRKAAEDPFQDAIVSEIKDEVAAMLTNAVNALTKNLISALQNGEYWHS